MSRATFRRLPRLVSVACELVRGWGRVRVERGMGMRPGTVGGVLSFDFVDASTALGLLPLSLNGFPLYSSSALSTSRVNVNNDNQWAY